MDFDIVLVGGGLANGLLALRLSQLRPDISVAIVEGGSRIGLAPEKWRVPLR